MKTLTHLVTTLILLLHVLVIQGQSTETTLYIDTVQYKNKQEIYTIPLRVKHFSNIRAFQFSLVISNTRGQAKIDSIASTGVLPGLSASNYNVYNDSTIFVLWDQAQSTGITLPDSTIIFNLIVRLSGNQGDCVRFVFQNDPVDIIALKGGTDKGFIPLTFGGAVCIRKYIGLSGVIIREDSVAVGKVLVDCSSYDSTYTTDPTGRFQFLELSQDSVHILKPRRNDNLTNGVNVGDIVRVREHILLKRLLDSPYKIIAADVDKSKAINVVDIALMRDAILTKITSFPNNESWRFIPLSYRFRDPKKPLLEDFPEFVRFERQTEDVIGIKFIGIKVGDVDLSAVAQ